MNVEMQVIELRRKHQTTWRDKSDWFWLMGLWEEVLELTFSMLGLHRGPIDWELTQISAICMNWLEKRGTP